MAAPVAMMMASITTTIDQTSSSPIEYTCSMCDIGTESNSSGSEATIDIYYENHGENFSGDFELELLLNDTTTRYETISSAEIEHQSSRQYTVSAGSNWDWNDVDEVVISAHPDS